MIDFRPVRGFIVCKLPGAPNSVRALPLTETAQKHIEAMIEEQLPDFLSPELTRVAFDPTYRTDDESVIQIEGFRLPEHITNAIEVPREVPPFTRSDSLVDTKAVFYVGGDNAAFFQCRRRVHVFDRKIWFLLSGDSFDAKPDESLPLVIDRRIDAVLHEGDLYFKSFANTNPILDMMEYVSEATDEDIELFAGSDLFHCGADALKRRCTRLHRQQIRALVRGDAIHIVTVSELAEAAASVRYPLQVQDGKIVLPDRGPELTSLLRFLDDRVYKGPVSGDPMEANSARRRTSTG